MYEGHRGYITRQMLTIDKKLLIFKLKEIHFSDYPYDVDGCCVLDFHSCKKKIACKVFNCRETRTVVLDLANDLDTIWMNNIVKRNRNKIRKAQHHEVKCIVNGCYEELLSIDTS